MEFERSIELDKTLAEPPRALGATDWQAVDSDAARFGMRAAAKPNPSTAEAHSLLGTAFRQLGNMDGAVAASESDEVKLTDILGRK